MQGLIASFESQGKDFLNGVAWEARGRGEFFETTPPPPTPVPSMASLKCIYRSQNKIRGWW